MPTQDREQLVQDKELFEQDGAVLVQGRGRPTQSRQMLSPDIGRPDDFSHDGDCDDGDGA